MFKLQLLTLVCLLVCVQEAPTHVPKKLPASVGTLSPPMDPRASCTHMLGWKGSLNV